MPLHIPGIPYEQKGAPNGVAELDGTGKVLASELPVIGAPLDEWDAATNTPTLSDGAGNAGDLYVVSVEGSQDLGSGSITFAVGDFVSYTGSKWIKIPRDVASASGDPTAQVGLSAVPGVAETFMRSDAAPALNQSIAPTWTGVHTFNNNVLLQGASVQAQANPGGTTLDFGTISAHNVNLATNNITRMSIAASGDVQMAAGYTTANPRSIAIKQYVDDGLANKLDVAGGDITGNLGVHGDIACLTDINANNDITAIRYLSAGGAIFLGDPGAAPAPDVTNTDSAIYRGATDNNTVLMKWADGSVDTLHVKGQTHDDGDPSVQTLVLKTDQSFTATETFAIVSDLSQIVLQDDVTQVRMVEAELYISGAFEAGIKCRFFNTIGMGTIQYKGSAFMPANAGQEMVFTDYDATNGINFDPDPDSIRKVTLSIQVTSPPTGGSYGSLFFEAAQQAQNAMPVTIHAGSKVTSRLVSST